MISIGSPSSNSLHGKVIGIFISARAKTLPVSVASVEAVAGCGLKGDRYGERQGTFSKPDGNGRDLTLIEKEVLDLMSDAFGVELSAAESRRNILTEGVALNDLVGKKFYVGKVLVEGMRLCDPCSHLERLTGKPVLKGLENRGGLRANILHDGIIKVGDVIKIL